MGFVKNKQIVSFITMAERNAQTKHTFVRNYQRILDCNFISIIIKIPDSSIMTTISMRPNNKAK